MKFTCPKCGAYHFGTRELEPVQILECHGFPRPSPLTGELTSGVGCGWTGTWEDARDEIYEDILYCTKFCGCGFSECALEYLREALRSMDSSLWTNRDIQYDERKRLFPYECGASWCVLYMLDGAGLTEHGSSIYHSWLADKGQALLDKLEAWHNLQRDPVSKAGGVG